MLKNTKAIPFVSNSYEVGAIVVSKNPHEHIPIEFFCISKISGDIAELQPIKIKTKPGKFLRFIRPVITYDPEYTSKELVIDMESPSIVLKIHKNRTNGILGFSIREGICSKIAGGWVKLWDGGTVPQHILN